MLLTAIEEFSYIIIVFSAYYPRGDNMRDKQEKKDLEKFNSITRKVKPENQNQEHNVRKEAVDAKRRQV